jgi:cell division protein ZapA
MATDAQLVQVEIFGQTYRLRSEDDPDYIESLAAVVDQKMQDIARETNAVDSLKVAVLAALNIADEARRGRSTGEKSRGEDETMNSKAGSGKLDHRMNEMLHILDEAISD